MMEIPPSMPAPLPSTQTAPRPWQETARNVLAIRPGERPLLPEFGWKAHRLPSLESEAARAVAGLLAEEALARWAPQLGIRRVEVLEVDGDAALLELRGDLGSAGIRVRHLGPGPEELLPGEGASS